MSRWQFEIENEIETFEVKPQGIENRLKWEPVGERVFDFKKSITDLTFIGDDYSKLLQYELTNHCTEQTLRVYQMCGLVRMLRFTAKFSMSSGKWDRDKCVVQFTIKESDKYLCVNRKREYNVFELMNPGVTANWEIIITAEHATCGLQGQMNCDDDYWETNYWGVFRGVVVLGNTAATYVRYRLKSPYFIKDEFDGWKYISYSDGYYNYVKKYDREKPDLLEMIGYEISDENDWVILNIGEINNNLKNGFNLYSVLDKLLKKNCPDLKIVSDFFQWNPENESEINYVTGLPSKITNLKLFQKSDIKRPNATNPATKQDISFIKLLGNVIRIFNCGYRLYGNVLRIEHISWFERQENLDLAQIAQDTDQITLRGTHRYSYDKTKLPKFEYFEWMDESSEEFEGTPIWYDNGCVEDDDDLAESLTNRIEYVTTDLLHCFTSEGSSGAGVSDSGFVIIATDENGKVLWRPNILNPGGSLPNNVLSWPNLHRNFWKHGRPQLVGFMNVPVDAEEPTGTIFASSIAVKDQNPFAIQLCCDDISEFDPSGLQKSVIGWGEVKSAELDFYTDIMIFELMFKQSQ